MPIFEYGCTECGCRFEKLVLSASRARQIQCPECGSVHVNKAISLVGAVSGNSTAAASADCAPSG
jgi:putative FmdB family regulatory protein